MPQKLIDMTNWIMKEHGVELSRLTVIKRNLTYKQEHNIKKGTYWDCLCECGNMTTARSEDIRNGKVLSCGCLQREIARKTLKEHHTNNSKNLIGLKVGILTVIKDSGQRQRTAGYIMWLCQCECGNTILVSTSDLLRGHVQSCGCIKSRGEALIQKILTNSNIPFIKQQTYSDLVSVKNGNMYYDFYINNQFLLEYDGIQHYQECKMCSDTLKDRQERDQIKNEYAKYHSIPLKRIPYWDYDKITLENIMSDKWLVNN